jgi:hypothetical protein
MKPTEKWKLSGSRGPPIRCACGKFVGNNSGVKNGSKKRCRECMRKHEKEYNREKSRRYRAGSSVCKSARI